MLKYISTSNHNPEEQIKSELSIEKGINLLDHLSTTNPETLLIKLKEHLKHKFNTSTDDETKSLPFLTEKLIYYLSAITTSKTFQNSEKETKASQVILSALKQLNSQHALYNAYFAVGSKANIKLEIVSTIVDETVKNGCIALSPSQLREILSNAISLENIPQSEGVMALFGKIFKKFKNYSEILNDVHLGKKLKLFFQLHKPRDEEAKRINFVILNFIPSVDNFKIKQNKEEYSGMTNEHHFLTAAGEFQKLIEGRFDLDSTYGLGAETKFITNAKMKLFHHILTEQGTKDVSFNFLEEKYKIKIENIEDCLFEGDKLQLFKVKIDYEGNKILVEYLRKFTYKREDVMQMKEQVGELRMKLKAFSSRLRIIE